MTERAKKRNPKTILKLPDLEHSKIAVLNSLSSMSSRRSYYHAIRDKSEAIAPAITQQQTPIQQHDYGIGF